MGERQNRLSKKDTIKAHGKWLVHNQDGINSLF